MMDDFAFGFWAWLGKEAAGLAIVIALIVAVFFFAIMAFLYDELVRRPLLKLRGICPQCRGGNKIVNGPFSMDCQACMGTGQYPRPRTDSTGLYGKPPA